MIKIENISYGYKPKQPIFSDISLKVGSGIYGLLGENGVGKTTLIHLICGLLFPWKGECSIDNSNSARRSPELLNRYFFLPEEMQMPFRILSPFQPQGFRTEPGRIAHRWKTETFRRLLRTTEESDAGVCLSPAHSPHPARRTYQRTGYHLPASLETYHQSHRG